MVQNHYHRRIFSLYSIWQIRVNRAATYFSLFGLGSWGCQSCQRLILPPTVSSSQCFFYHFSPFPLSSNSASGLVSSSQSVSIRKESSILGENKITLLSLLSPVFSLPYLSWKSYLNKCPLFPSSLPHLPFATEPRMCVHAKSLQLCSNSVTPWTVACQTPVSKGFSRQEYWSGLSCPSPGDLSHPRIEPISLYVCCIGRQVLYHSCHLGSQDNTY